MNADEHRCAWNGWRSRSERPPGRRESGWRRAWESARQIAAVLVFSALVFAMPAAASEQFAYTLQTSPGFVVFQVRCPDPSPRFRTFVLDRPRRCLADVTAKGPVSLRAPQTIPLPADSPLEMIRIASHRDFLRLVFHLPHGRKIVRNVRQDGVNFVFSSGATWRLV